MFSLIRSSEFSTQCPVEYVVFYPGWWWQEIFLALCERWWLFCSFWMVLYLVWITSSRKCQSVPSWGPGGALCRFPELYLLSLPPLQALNSGLWSSWHFLASGSICPTQGDLQAPPGLPSLHLSWKASRPCAGAVGGSPLWPSLSNQYPSLSDIQCPENFFIIYFVCSFNCFR